MPTSHTKRWKKASVQHAMEAAKRRLYEALPLIGMRSEAACPTCPLNLMCTMGQPLIVNQRHVSRAAIAEDLHEARLRGDPNVEGVDVDDVTNYLGIPTVTRNVNKIRVCSYCMCVYFEYELTTYLCGVIRMGTRHGGRTRKDCVNIALTGNGPGRAFQGVMTSDISWTKGCKRAAQKKGQGYSCFDHLEGHFMEIRG